MRQQIFAGLGSLVLTVVGLVMAGPPQNELRPLTSEPPGAAQVAPAKVGDGAARPRMPLFYYNGDRKVYLFDTGQAVAKLKAPAEREKFAAKSEAVVPTEGTALESLQPVLQGRGLVVVTTRGPRAMSLRPADRPADLAYTLPIVRESTRPAIPATADEGGGSAAIVMTPEISVRFTDAFFEGVQGAADRRAKVEQYVKDQHLVIGTPADRPLRIPNAFSLVLADEPVTHDRLISAANSLYEKGKPEGLILYAKPNFIRPIQLHQSPAIQDPRYSGQWHLNNTGQGQGGLVDADVDAPEAWRVTEGDPSIRIAIIDDSIQKSHPDLKANYQAGRHYDGLGGHDDDPSPRRSDQYHGTCCAGVAVAAANDLGVRGVAPRCGLIGVHFWDTQEDEEIADAFYFAADPDGDPDTDDGAAVISCSWSISPLAEAPADAITAIDEVSRTGRKGKGVLVVFSAGNRFGEISKNQRMGTVESVICVGATNFRDVRSNYSNYGPELDVMAPSGDVNQIFNNPNRPDFFPLAIDTTDNTDDMPRRPNNDRSGLAVGDYTGTGQTSFNGTSAAAPLAAGICGLIFSANPGLSAVQARSILEHTCDRVRGPESVDQDIVQSYHPTTSHNIYYGYGRVNANRAVLAARAAITNPGSIWPERVGEFAATLASPGQVQLSWRTPRDNPEGMLIVIGTAPIRWKPRDGERFRAGDMVTPSARVLFQGRVDGITVAADQVNPTHYAIFAHSADHRYSWGQEATFTPAPPTPTPVPAGAAASRPARPGRTKAVTGRATGR